MSVSSDLQDATTHVSQEAQPGPNGSELNILVAKRGVTDRYRRSYVLRSVAA